MTARMKELPDLRQKIDEIDDRIVELISERFRITDEIGTLKADSSAPALDAEREQHIISRLTEKSGKLAVNPDLISSIFRSILSEVVLKHQQIFRTGSDSR